MQVEFSLILTLGILLVLSPLIKSFSERLGIPSLVGYILLGFLVRIVDNHLYSASDTFDATFAVLAQLGVVALLFRVGLKSHTRALLAKLPDASFIWVGDVVTNIALGFIVARYVLTLPLETSLVIATAFSATSVAVSVAVWDEMHKLNTSLGQLLVDVAELDDLSGVLLLAVLLAVIPVLQSSTPELFPIAGTTAAVVIIKLALFIVGCYLFSHFLEPGFTRFNSKWETSKTGLAITVLGAGLAIAAVAGYLGFSLAIGALFAGLAFSRDPQAVGTDAKFSYFYELLTPFFFIYIGMQIDPGAVVPSLGLAAVLFFPAAVGKFVGVAGPALKLVKRRDAALLGISMIPRAEITMVIVHQCRQFGESIVSNRVYAAMILVAVVTSLVAPVMLRSYLARQSN